MPEKKKNQKEYWGKERKFATGGLERFQILDDLPGQ